MYHTYRILLPLIFTALVRRTEGNCEDLPPELKNKQWFYRPDSNPYFNFTNTIITYANEDVADCLQVTASGGEYMIKANTSSNEPICFYVLGGDTNPGEQAAIFVKIISGANADDCTPPNREIQIVVPLNESENTANDALSEILENRACSPGFKQGSYLLQYYNGTDFECPCSPSECNVTVSDQGIRHETCQDINYILNKGLSTSSIDLFCLNYFNDSQYLPDAVDIQAVAIKLADEFIWTCINYRVESDGCLSYSTPTILIGNIWCRDDHNPDSTNSATAFKACPLQCTESVCLNGGTCVDEFNDVSCICAPGYSGENCSVGNCDGLPDELKDKRWAHAIGGLEFYNFTEALVSLNNADAADCREVLESGREYNVLAKTSDDGILCIQILGVDAPEENAALFIRHKTADSQCVNDAPIKVAVPFNETAGDLFSGFSGAEENGQRDPAIKLGSYLLQYRSNTGSLDCPCSPSECNATVLQEGGRSIIRHQTCEDVRYLGIGTMSIDLFILNYFNDSTGDPLLALAIINDPSYLWTCGRHHVEEDGCLLYTIEHINHRPTECHVTEADNTYFAHNVFKACPAQCNSTNCQNGDCSEQFNVTGINCTCFPGYTGEDCSTDINECAGDPCENGSCQDLLNGYECYCYHGFVGVNCSQACDPGTAHVGDKCVDCTAGYYETNYTCVLCPSNSTTFNNRSVGLDHCNCTNGFIGNVTEEDCFCEAGSFINSNGSCEPCDSGKISTTRDSASCENCGEFTIVNENRTACLCAGNGMQNTSGDCVCMEDYYRNGTECVPCGNYSHAEEGNFRECACLDTFETDSELNCICPASKYINITARECVPCEAGSVSDSVDSLTCTICAHPTTNDASSTSCVCVKDYYMNMTSSQCDACPNNGTTLTEGSTNITDCDDCAVVVCENGGTCDDLDFGYICLCAAGFTGDHCETNVDECQGDPCIHGNCTDEINGYRCNCISGYTGTNCETEIDECETNPCNNGGSCNDAINSFNCSCPEGVAGELCETECAGNDISAGGFVSACTSCNTSNHMIANSDNSDCYCESNYYLDGAVCVRCSTNQVSSAGSTDSSQCICKAGYQLVDGSCTKCPRNTFSTDTSNSCTPCEARTPITLDEGSATCLPCVAGCQEDGVLLTGMFPACNSCSNFFECYNGVGLGGFCWTDTKYNLVTERCQPEANVTCPDISDAPCESCESDGSCINRTCRCDEGFETVGEICSKCPGPCPQNAECDHHAAECVCQFGYQWNAGRTRCDEVSTTINFRILIIVAPLWCDRPVELRDFRFWLESQFGGRFHIQIRSCSHGSSIIDFVAESLSQISSQQSKAVFDNITQLFADGSVEVNGSHPVLPGSTLLDELGAELELVDACSVYRHLCVTGECVLNDLEEAYCECPDGSSGDYCSVEDENSSSPAVLIAALLFAGTVLILTAVLVILVDRIKTKNLAKRQKLQVQVKPASYFGPVSNYSGYYRGWRK